MIRRILQTPRVLPFGSGILAIASAFGVAPTADAGCPPVPWPPGVDLGPAVVEATLIPDPAGGATASDWSGPRELVAAVAATLGDCDLPERARVAWPFGAPPINVTGVVHARGTGAPVALTLHVADRTVRTGVDGTFALRNVAPGEWTVEAVDPEWRVPGPMSFALDGGQQVELDVWVVPDRLRDDEIVGRYGATGPGASARVVAAERGAAIPGSLDDPLRALGAEPGIARSPYDAGWLLVRGGDFDDVGLYLDGVPVPLVYHLGGFTTVLHPDLVEAVRYWPGVFPARYGDALSGAVDLVTHRPGDRALVDAGANLVFVGAYAETPTRFGGLAVAARRSWLDGALSLAVGPDGAKIAPRFWDATAQASVGDASFLVAVAADGIDAPASTGEGLVSIEQRAVQAQAVVPIGPVTVRPWLAWSRQELVGDEPPQIVAQAYPGMRVEGRADVDGAELNAGVEGQARQFHLAIGGEERQRPVWTLDPYGGLSAGDRVEAWTEARFSVVAVGGEPAQELRTGWGPRAGVRWHVGPAVDLHGEVGRAVQLPAVTVWLPVDDGVYLDLERSDQVAAGVAIERGPVAVGADLYARRADDLAEIEVDGSIGDAYGRARGVEGQVRVREEGFDGTALVEVTRSERREDPDEPWHPSPFDAPLRVDLLAVQALPGSHLVSLRVRGGSGYPRLLEAGIRTPIEAYDLLRQQTVGVDVAADALRLEPLWTVDLGYGHDVWFRRWRLRVSLDVQNVMSRRVVEPVITGFGDAPRPTYGVGLPVLPIFAVDGRWFGRADP